ncbi:hypothetical protein DER46DRAFT_600046, partial [Fusarium sp. MPI-SDFR-AT-0072]
VGRANIWVPVGILSPTKRSIDKAKVTAQMPYQKLTGTNGFRKQLYYPHSFFLAAWLGPGHPLLHSIRKKHIRSLGRPVPDRRHQLHRGSSKSYQENNQQLTSQWPQHCYQRISPRCPERIRQRH